MLLQSKLFSPRLQQILYDKPQAPPRDAARVCQIPQRMWVQAVGPALSAEAVLLPADGACNTNPGTNTLTATRPRLTDHTPSAGRAYASHISSNSATPA